METTPEMRKQSCFFPTLANPFTSSAAHAELDTQNSEAIKKILRIRSRDLPVTCLRPDDLACCTGVRSFALP
jgi:hypothetical protein